MATLTMEAGGREFTFRYSVRALVEAEEKYGSIYKLQKQMISDEKPTVAALDLMACMANAHEHYKKRPENFTREWFRDHLSLKQLAEAKIMTQNAITVGWKREVEEDEDIPVDEVLKEMEEERKKKEAEKRQTSGQSPDD